MKRIISLFIAVVFGISCTTPSSDQKIVEKLNAQDFIQKYNTNKSTSLLIDVRTPSEYNDGFILDAQNINYYNDDFLEQISQLDTNKTVFIYCKSGGRSAHAAKKFARIGFQKVYDLKGGYSNYAQK